MNPFNPNDRSGYGSSGTGMKAAMKTLTPAGMTGRGLRNTERPFRTMKRLHAGETDR